MTICQERLTGSPDGQRHSGLFWVWSGKVTNLYWLSFLPMWTVKSTLQLPSFAGTSLWHRSTDWVWRLQTKCRRWTNHFQEVPCTPRPHKEWGIVWTELGYPTKRWSHLSTVAGFHRMCTALCQQECTSSKYRRTSFSLGLLVSSSKWDKSIWRLLLRPTGQL